LKVKNKKEGILEENRLLFAVPLINLPIYITKT
jgi:hypothetical protein